ncbi:MAG: L,D-transpeptidase family protein [Gemmatimonadota bacterium]|nr:L,D-transpeptidase family protein [Gemmatimonadota bacterium]MDH4347658.1 L,D-transpeptidase family protein [Gemmatimonadota bacterium]MDH5284437.1 L,D-transpeptidase family protein [Gemmatimonadota bacterium]
MRRALLTLLLSGLPLPASLAGQSPAIIEILGAARHEEIRWPDIRDVAPALREVYARRGWSPLWYRAGEPTVAARAMVQVLAEAAVRGLEPEDYDARWLAAEFARPHDPGGPVRDRVDAALSVAAARFAQALRRGRVSAEAIHATYKLPVEPFDLGSAVESLAQSAQPNDVLVRLEPPQWHYWLLVAALVRYQQLARDSARFVLPPMPRRLKPGATYAGAATLGRLLDLLGDWRDTSALSALDSTYDRPLVLAIQRFQLRHGLTPDGVIGDSTRVRLEHPFEARIRQIGLSLERWRWLPRHYDTPPIFVNPPSFRLYALSGLQDIESSTLRMNVVVGRAFTSQTPLFAANLEYLVFSPTWYVPAEIAAKEIKPEAMKDPAFLAQNGYELVERNEVIPPWPEHVVRIGQGVTVRQTPGPHNALGMVKFVMPNDFDVYLHDTPSKALFERTRRDASHGCIRVGDPFALARFLLRDRPEWSDEAIREAMNAGQPRRVNLTAPIPVFVVYATAIARENGEVYFYSDLYGHDAALETALAGGYPYR